VECQGETLGEFALEQAPVVIELQDPESGRVITTLTLEPGESVRPSPPARAAFAGMPALTADGDLYHDETVDLVLSNEDTIAKGLARIREAARGAPGTINVELPTSQAEPEPIAPHEPDDSPEILELSEPSVSLGPVVPGTHDPDADTLNRELSPLEQAHLDTLRQRRDTLADVETLRREPETLDGPDTMRKAPQAAWSVEPAEPAGEPQAAPPELTEQDSPLPGPPPSESDRSVTRTLSNGLVDLIDQAEQEAQAAAKARPTVTQELASEDGARPTHVEQPAVEPLDEGPPTRVSREPFIPDPVAPAPPEPAPVPPSGEDTRNLDDVEAGTQVEETPPPMEIGTDFADDDDEPVTVVAQSPHSKRQREPLAHGAYDELPVGRGRPSGDDLSLGMPQDPGLVGPPRRVGAYDEMPVPDNRREPGDDLSLSLPYESGLTDASIAELSLPVPSMDGEATGSPLDASLSLSLPLPDVFEAESDDDITLPLPEDADSEEGEPLGGMEPTVTNAFSAMQVEPLAAPQSVTPRLMDTTAGFARDPSTERLEGAEVWFRRHGEWTPRGALNLGQHVQAFGGMVRCDDSGGLVVLAGPRLHGSATLPSGELRQINSGQQAVHLPPGTSVIMWQGEQGIYVRSNVAADASGPVLDQGPVVYRRPPRSRSWKPPASDLEET